LPKLRVPMISARSRFLSAPATISEAEAEPLLIKHDHREVGLAVAALGAARLALAALDGGDHRAAVDEQVGGRDRLVEQAARVAAQVEDDAGGAAGAQLGQRPVGLGAVEPWKLEILIRPTPPSRSLARTDSLEISARIRSKRRARRRPCALIHRVTGVSGLPRMRSTASSLVNTSVDWCRS
jgi:hypothetical protein